MKERPILFSAPMVRAILEGLKTQTRRLVKLPVIDKDIGCELSGGNLAASQRDTLRHCPYGQPGDRLWVKENFIPRPGGIDDIWIVYAADEAKNGFGAASGQVSEQGLGVYYRMLDRAVRRMNAGKKPELRPNIYLPRWASRITLEITAVRVERLSAITRGDCMAEGCEFPNMASGPDPRDWYRELWESINGPGSWDANPWVWVIEFRRVA